MLSFLHRNYLQFHIRNKGFGPNNFQILSQHGKWCFLLSQLWWDPFIKFIIRFIMNIRGESTISLYFGLPKYFSFDLDDSHLQVNNQNGNQPFLELKMSKLMSIIIFQNYEQGCQYRTGGRTGLATGTIYFGYRSIPVYRFGFTAIFYIYIYICMYVCVSVYIYYNKYKSLQ